MIQINDAPAVEVRYRNSGKVSLAAAIICSAWTIAFSIQGWLIGPDIELEGRVRSLVGSALLSGLLYLVYTIRRDRKLLLNPVTCLAMAMFAWHLSFLVIYGLGLASEFRTGFILGRAPEANLKGVSICVAGVSSFLLGICCVEYFSPRFRYKECSTPSGMLGAFYLVQMAGAALIWIYFFLRGGAVIGDYASVFVDEDPLRRWYNLGVLFLFSGTGALLVLARNLRQILLIFGIGILGAAPALIMGTRWILFSMLLVFASGWGLFGRRLPLLSMSVAGLMLLAVGTVVKEVRSGEAFSVSGAQKLVSDRGGPNFVVEFFEEIGTTVASCILAADLIDSGYPRLGGRTYIDAFKTVVPGLSGVSRMDTPDHLIAMEYFPQEYEDRGFTIGSSVIAEMYLNFGLAGVVLGQCALGAMIAASWQRAAKSRQWRLACYVALGFLIFGMRSDAFTWMRPLSRALVLVLVFDWIAGRFSSLWGEKGDLPKEHRSKRA